MVELFGNIHYKAKHLYQIGKNGFGVCIILMGFAMIFDIISRAEDLREYYLFWRLITGQGNERPAKTDLEEFQRDSLFEFMRLSLSASFILAGGLIIAEKIYGALLTILCSVVVAFVFANPWIFLDQTEQQHSWILLLKFCAIIGGALFKSSFKFNRTANLVNIFNRNFGVQQNKKPPVCYYKLLNISASATQDDIKQAYYELAKKYHPDAIKDEDKDKYQDLFKDITEAYSILGDTEKRARYDQLIFGDSTRGDFNNQEAYEYWKERPQQGKRMKQYGEDQQERIKDRLKNYKDYEDFLKRMEHHREKNSAREHLMRGEGFKDLNLKYGPDYDYFQAVEEEQKDKYNKYRERYYEGYWDTKENHEYYSQPTMTRAWIQLKKVISFYYDLAIVWGILAAAFILYNAHTTALKTNVSHAYLQIMKERSLRPLDYQNLQDHKFSDEDFAKPRNTEKDPSK